jgi:chromosome transmission fidelity protein 1
MDLEAKNFHHPYTPYDIQLQFMQALYACIEDRKVGIFESPTGMPCRLCLIMRHP